ncbi:zinc ribbon domain-containing protein [Carnobacterium maltaromaticum]|uniref:zinc ribbon domain-containing protein n=1 Tax=Carnobacterium maltaromaticum TaxID=2751 RepID=UPI00295E9EE8|nr:zinc ribbon domain-containing protein [Carnobacterium maltaromaticum]
MYCENCGKLNKENGNFCEHCGNALTKEIKTNIKQNKYQEMAKEVLSKIYQNKTKRLIAIVVISIVTIFFISQNFISVEKRIEKDSVGLVNQVLDTSPYVRNAKAKEVFITKKIDDEKYEGKAILENGITIKINIEYYRNKGKLYVEIPNYELWNLR